VPQELKRANVVTRLDESRVVSGVGPSVQLPLQAKRSTAYASVITPTASGIPAASKDVARFHRQDGGGTSARNTIHGSLMSASPQGAIPSTQLSSQPKMATVLAHVPHSFNLSGSPPTGRRSQSAERLLPIANRSMSRASLFAPSTNSDMASSRLQSRTPTAPIGQAAAPTSSELQTLATAVRTANVSGGTVARKGPFREGTV